MEALPPPMPARRSAATSCDLHPGESFTGFCASCLRERLAGLDAAASAGSSGGRKSTSALKSLFPAPLPAAALLRRCKSFSSHSRGAAAAASSVGGDASGRHTLLALFHQDDRGAATESSNSRVVKIEDDDDEECEIMPVDPVIAVETSRESEQHWFTGEPVDASGNAMPMKEHIDVEIGNGKKPMPKDLKEIAGSFWLAASVFSKKWQKWRRKQKIKKQQQAGGCSSKAAAAAMPPPEKLTKTSFLRRRRPRDVNSEFYNDGALMGRRSCDTDPRFSIDIGRMSVDDVGFGWDEPRASWDGYLIGGAGNWRSSGVLPSRLPPILSAVEDSPVPVVERFDGQIPVEDDSAAVPGGSVQTREYYADSARRRKSFERLGSVRRPSFEANEPTQIVNGKVPQVSSSEFHHLHHAESVHDRGFSSNSLMEDVSGSLEAVFAAPEKKAKKWKKVWRIWGLIHRRTNSRQNGVGNRVERSFSEPWPELRAKSFHGNMQRSNSNVSARSSFSSNSGGLGSSRRMTGIETNSCIARKKREEFTLERNRSVRHSPSRVGNGMLQFYLTPMRRSGRRSGLPMKGGPISSHAFAASLLRLY